MEQGIQEGIVSAGVEPGVMLSLSGNHTRGRGVPSTQLPGVGFPVETRRKGKPHRGVSGRPSHSSAPREYTVYGSLRIDGVGYPVQKFTFSYTNGALRAVNHPKGGWPSVELQLTLRPGTEVFDLTSLRAVPQGDTIRAQLLVTRVLLGMALTRRFEFVFRDFTQGFAYDLDVPSPDLKELRNRAALYRKFAYIEDTFKVWFTLPKYIPGEAVRYVDELFRGISEGEYFQRVEEARFGVNPIAIDLDSPPFHGIGPIEDHQDNPVTLFGHVFNVGRISLRAENAEISSPRDLRLLRSSSEPRVMTRLRLHDFRVLLRFERFTALGPAERERRLRIFMDGLRREEPEAITESIFDPLILPLDAQGAEQVAFGWIQIHALPDGIRPEAPEPSTDGRYWRVPLALRYASGQAAPLAELQVDIYTGLVTAGFNHEDLLQRADTAARDLLHAG